MDIQKFTKETRDFILQTLDLWHVNGAAVAVVKDGQVILCEGYGYRDREQDLPMTSNTLMPIASCTKAFTSMAVGLLVDDGKLEWDKPLRTYLPSFKMMDDVASEHMTPRDLLCHRSGLPRHDMLWYLSDFNRQQIFDRLRYLEPNSDFRSAFYYQNMMFMVAGMLVGAIAGKSWEAVIQERIFDRLGMKRSNLSTVVTEQDSDHGSPYIYLKGEQRKIPFYEADGEKDALGPAGNICSCVSDISKWLLLHLSGGKLGDQQFISTHNLEEMHKPHVFIDDPIVRQRFEADFYCYGLGWSLRSQKGQLLISHGGNMDGFSSYVSFLPRQNAGVVVLTNGDGYYNSIPYTISYTIYDRLLGLEPTDWNEKFKSYADELLEAEKRSESQSGEERKPAPASHPIEDYLGKYEHPGYGILSVQKEGEGLKLVANDKITLALEHYHYDVFEAYLERFNWHLKITFRLDAKGNISTLEAQMEQMVKAIPFTRVADKRLSDPAFLKQLTGLYEVQGMEMEVRIKEGKLYASLPGQSHELLPYQGLEFNLKDQPGFSLSFQCDPNGVYSQVLVSQPGAVFVAKRKT